MDPFGEYDDYEIWQALFRVHLADPPNNPIHGKSHFASVVRDLDMDVGPDWSVGDRQLLCIARGLLRDCVKLVIFEEAQLTSEEDEKVRCVIEEEFTESVRKNCVCVCLDYGSYIFSC